MPATNQQQGSWKYSGKQQEIRLMSPLISGFISTLPAVQKNFAISCLKW
jgi:hypothetical protein